MSWKMPNCTSTWSHQVAACVPLTWEKIWKYPTTKETWPKDNASRKWWAPGSNVPSGKNIGPALPKCFDLHLTVQSHEKPWVLPVVSERAFRAPNRRSRSRCESESPGSGPSGIICSCLLNASQFSCRFPTGVVGVTQTLCLHPGTVFPALHLPFSAGPPYTSTQFPSFVSKWTNLLCTFGIFSQKMYVF